MFLIAEYCGSASMAFVILKTFELPLALLDLSGHGLDGCGLAGFGQKIVGLLGVAWLDMTWLGMAWLVKLVNIVRSPQNLKISPTCLLFFSSVVLYRSYICNMYLVQLIEHPILRIPNILFV